VEAVVLDPAGDALSQIAAALRPHRDLATLHIIAHGRPGEVRFSAGALSRDTIAAHARALAQIGAALAEDGTIALWSCETARGEAGRAFVEALSEATCAEMRASSGAVGHRDLGGRWL